MSKTQSYHQIYGNGQRPYSLHDRNRTYNASESNRKFNEKLYDIPYKGKTSELFAKTVLERAYILDRWVFCLQRRECFRRNASISVQGGNTVRNVQMTCLLRYFQSVYVQYTSFIQTDGLEKKSSSFSGWNMVE